MDANKTFVKLFYKALLVLLCFAATQKAFAQIVFNNLNSYSQDFNSLPSGNSSTWNDNSTLPGWYISGSNGAAVSVSKGGSSQAGVVSYGADNSSERALGHTVIGTYYGLRIKNNTNKTFTYFTIEYTSEVWRKPPGNRVITSLFSYQKNAGSVTSGTWNQVAGGSMNWRSGSGSATLLNGNNAANRFTHVFTLPVTLAPGEDVMLRWQHEARKGFELALDDINITPGIGAAPATVFYSRPDVLSVKYLNNLENWDNDPVGNGTQQPTSFSNATFVVTGRAFSTINANWVIGQNAKIVVEQGELQIPAAYSVTGLIDVAANATLTLDNIILPKLGILDDNSVVVFNSSAVLPAAEFGKLIVNNGSKRLGDDTQIKNALVLNSSLILDGSDLEFGSNGYIQNASTANYIVTNGTGALKMTVKNNNQNVVFPVGTQLKYLPVKIKQDASATTDIFSAKVIDGIYSSYDISDNPIGSLLTGNALNKTWIVGEEVKGGSNVSLTIPFDLISLASDILAGFDVQNAIISHYENNQWDNLPADPSLLKTTLGLLTSYEITRNGITSFSPFSVKKSENNPLPVELVAFTANRSQNGIVCNWKTAQELNNDFFTVERSADGLEFIETGTVKGKGTTSQTSVYTFVDAGAPEMLAYYRLRQTDFGGTVSYSKIIMVQPSAKKQPVFNVYPNPTASLATLQILSGEAGNPIKVCVYDVRGRFMNEQVVEPYVMKRGLPIDLTAQPAGIYLIKIATENTLSVLRVIRQ